MRQSAEGTGDTALQIPSWRPEAEGGSQDVRAAFPLSPSPVSWVLALGLGRRPQTYNHPRGQETPGFGHPVEKGSSKDQVLGEGAVGWGRWGPQDTAKFRVHAPPWGIWSSPCPPPATTSCLDKTPRRWPGWQHHDGWDWLEIRAGSALTPFAVRLVDVAFSWERCGGTRLLQGGDFSGCNGEECGPGSGRSPVAPSALSPRFARAPGRFVQGRHRGIKPGGLAGRSYLRVLKQAPRRAEQVSTCSGLALVAHLNDKEKKKITQNFSRALSNSLGLTTKRTGLPCTPPSTGTALHEPGTPGTKAHSAADPCPPLAPAQGWGILPISLGCSLDYTPLLRPLELFYIRNISKRGWK